ncbi:unnamed protein product [Acanthosepion pharaonis]|uniref:Uncharacterized protein n=1 Tax=Acanthosepion pharaonis TaxID=158019 RepID=A0A812CTD5_ACAPH|nr:unnamed protein product [Sepia pharaonis]
MSLPALPLHVSPGAFATCLYLQLGPLFVIKVRLLICPYSSLAPSLSLFFGNYLSLHIRSLFDHKSSSPYLLRLPEPSLLNPALSFLLKFFISLVISSFLAFHPRHIFPNSSAICFSLLFRGIFSVVFRYIFVTSLPHHICLSAICLYFKNFDVPLNSLSISLSLSLSLSLSIYLYLSIYNINFIYWMVERKQIFNIFNIIR